MQTRQHIIRTASGLFLRYGLKKTTMDDVAKVCRMGKATIYKYFKNKEDLYREILKNEMEYIISEMEKRIESIQSVREKLRALFEAEYLLLKGDSNISYVLTNIVDLADSKIREIVNEFFERQRRIIRSILKEGVERGEIVVKDISLLSLAMMAAGQGLFNYFKNIQDEKRAIKSMEYLIDTLFYGIEA